MKNLGHATAYGYAKSKGYTGTEEEFAELMADYASVGEAAAESAAEAAESASDAADSASDADTAKTAAQTAQSAAEAAQSAAETAKTAAQTAKTQAETAKTDAQTAKTQAQSAQTAAAASASAAATSATNAGNSATAASGSATAAAGSATAAQTAQTAAETAQAAAEDAAESVEGSAAQIAQNAEDISDLKQDLSYQKSYGADVTSLEFSTLNYLGIKCEKSGNGYHIYGTATDTVNITVCRFNQIAGQRYSYMSNSSVPFTTGFYLYLYGVNGTEWVKTDYEWIAAESKEISIKLYVDKNTTVDFTVDPVILKNKSNAELETLISDSDERFEQVIAYKPKFNMEYGSINMGNTPPTYGDRSSRVRTMENVTIRLAKNDVVVVSENNIVFYIAWINDEGTQTSRGWLQGSFTMPEDGDTYLLFRYNPETTISNIEDITDKVTIFRHNSLYGEYHKDITINKRRGFYIRSINHRGYNRYAPENTIPAFKLSSYMGFDACETDVRFTSDDVPVLLHDVSINRTARNADGTEITGTVNIADITYEQASTYDFGIYKGGQFAGTKIPTFNEYMALCKKLGIEAYVEIKVETDNHVKQLVDIARSYDMLKHTSWVAFSYTALTKVLAEYPSARIGLLGSVNMETLNILKTGQSNLFMDADRTLISAQDIADLIDNDIPLELYTVNGIGSADELAPYVSGFTSDYYNLGYELYKYNMDGVLVD